MSCLIVYSMIINNIDRLFNSSCGMSCGYLLDKSPTFWNPIDYVLRRLSSHHERFYNIQLFLDTGFFAIILIYTFVCILYGIVKIGINFFSLELFKIRRRDTMPQALSIVSILVIIMMFAFSMQLMSIAPMYVTFGDQKQDNGDFCDLKAIHLSRWTKYDSDKCNITMIAQLYTKILLSVPLFSLIYYLLSWAFIALFIIFLIYHSNKRAYQSQNLSGYSSLNQDDDSE